MWRIIMRGLSGRRAQRKNKDSRMKMQQGIPNLLTSLRMSKSL